ncbi:Dioxygenase str8 [Candida tropicalis]
MLRRFPFRHFQRCHSSLAVLNFNNKEITVSINEKPVTFNNVFLRDSSRSPDSVDPISSQKLFTTAEGATNLSINGPPSVENSKEPSLKVQWNNDGKIIDSSYPVSFLERYSTPSGRRIEKFFDEDRKLWDKNELESNLPSLQIDYKDILNKEESFFQALYNLNRYGLTFVNNIPQPELTNMTEENSYQWPVFQIASKFGYIKKTFYGTLFDVKNQKEKAVNIAYTNTFLPLHMDLLYYESPPGLQLLHAIQNSTLGGENIFCDSFLAAEHVRQVDPDAYTALTKIPITYHYDNNNEYYYYKRPLIIEDAEIGAGFPKISAINYAPPFQGPLEHGIEKSDPNYSMFDDFIRGMKLFETYINEPENHFEIKMKEGSCVIFENRRALHSRNEFSDSNNGDRWLMGTYVDGDSFRSKLRVGYRKFLINKN